MEENKIMNEVVEGAQVMETAGKAGSGRVIATVVIGVAAIAGTAVGIVKLIKHRKAKKQISLTEESETVEEQDNVVDGNFEN